MNRRWCSLEIALHISFRGRAPIQLRVIVDESQILAFDLSVFCFFFQALKILESFRPRLRITAPALRASARRCSTLPARLRAARVVARACCCYGARSRASSEYKCAAEEQVHERKPTSSHHRMPRWPMPTETCQEALAGPCVGPDLRARRSAGRTAFCDGESGAQEKRRWTRVGDDHYKRAPAAHRAGMRAVLKSTSLFSRPARVRITAPALRASARRCSTLPARLRAARVVACSCCCYGARSRASSGYKCAATEQVHERKPASSHHRMPR